MLCQKCKKNPATVHMQQFIGGNKTEMHLCQECSAIKMDMPISFEHIFKGFLTSLQSMTANRPTQTPSTPCGRCGMTYEQFKSSGKLGCEACYPAFAKEIEALFKNVQGSTRHEGKFPQRMGVDMRVRREADTLRIQLKEAVDAENYEDAARLRDILRAMNLPSEVKSP
ncbi:MAG: UvrB/UvrC motif-containing protein [Defluviitaleaceae bacterium]|nr:UvrB/UvrC motif-containing protein [Defluviitaleaceae bacterium]MCL2238676.1 UvrB/UvrC motif-containing protein [Defluviitaleaceae bacterium]